MTANSSENPTLVYLDNAQVVWARDGRLPGWNRTVAAQMAEEHGFTWALSSAHLDDCSHRDDQGRLQQAADILSWPNGIVLDIGPGLEQREALKHYNEWLTGETTDGFAVDVLPSIPAVPDELRIDELESATRQVMVQLADQLNERRQQKDLLAPAEQQRRMLLESSKDPVYREIMDELISGRPIPERFRDQSGWVKTIVAAQQQLDSFVPAEMKESVQAQLEKMKDQDSMFAMLADLFAQANPLQLGEEPLRVFTRWFPRLPEELQAELRNDLAQLRDLFVHWLNNPFRTPSLWVRLEVEAALERNPQARVLSSETTDLLHVGALTYVTVLFADARVHDAVRTSHLPPELKAKCWPNNRFGEFLKDPEPFLERGRGNGRGPE